MHDTCATAHHTHHHGLWLWNTVIITKIWVKQTIACDFFYAGLFWMHCHLKASGHRHTKSAHKDFYRSSEHINTLMLCKQRHWDCSQLHVWHCLSPSLTGEWASGRLLVRMTRLMCHHVANLWQINLIHGETLFSLSIWQLCHVFVATDPTTGWNVQQAWRSSF